MSKKSCWIGYGVSYGALLVVTFVTWHAAAVFDPKNDGDAFKGWALEFAAWALGFLSLALYLLMYTISRNAREETESDESSP